MIKACDYSDRVIIVMKFLGEDRDGSSGDPSHYFYSNTFFCDSIVKLN